MTWLWRRFVHWLTRDEEAERMARRAREHALQAEYRGNVWPYER